MYCFTRKTNCFTGETLLGANRVRIHILRVNQKYYYILMYCFAGKVNGFTRNVNCLTRKDKCLTRKMLDK